MNYFSYTFKCSQMPTRMTVHALVRHLFEEHDNPMFKASIKVRNIVIDSPVDLHLESCEYAFNTDFNDKIICKYVGFKQLNLPTYEKDQELNLSGLISYAINIHGGKPKCPVFNGQFETHPLTKKSLKDHFKQRLEDDLGVKIPLMHPKFFERQINEVLNNKIQINNQIVIQQLPVVIDDPEKFKSHHFKSYFQRNSYGMGTLVTH